MKKPDTFIAPLATLFSACECETFPSWAKSFAWGIEKRRDFKTSERMVEYGGIMTRYNWIDGVNRQCEKPVTAGRPGWEAGYLYRIEKIISVFLIV